MPTVRMWTDADVALNPQVKVVLDDIRAVRQSDFINNFWRGLALLHGSAVEPGEAIE